MTEFGTCALCGEPVTSLQTPCFHVEGWEALRGAGGANQIIGRKRDERRVAHRTCVERAVERERRGIAPEQAALL